MSSAGQQTARPCGYFPAFMIDRKVQPSGQEKQRHSSSFRSKYRDIKAIPSFKRSKTRRMAEEGQAIKDMGKGGDEAGIKRRPLTHCAAFGLVLLFLVLLVACVRQIHAFIESHSEFLRLHGIIGDGPSGVRLHLHRRG